MSNETHQNSGNSISAWVQNELMPINMNVRTTFNADIDAFISTLNDSVELLGLGEALHGGEEILQFRNDLFQRLVEQHGYCAIAIESSFPKSRILNDFIMGHRSAVDDTIWDRGFSHDLGRLPVNRELIEWMRHYNATHQNKIRFYGFDSPTEAGPTDSPRMLLYFVLDYLASVDEGSATTRREQIDALLGEDALWENPEAAFNPALAIGLSPAATALRIATEDLISELQVRRPELVEKRGMEDFLEAMQHAALARQLLNYHALLAGTSGNRYMELLGLRDAMMADNLSYIVARERPYGKVLVFAHNSHLQRSKAEWQMGSQRVVWWPAGSHLDLLFGSRYALIGSAVGISPENGIAEPEANTLEAVLTHTAPPVHLLPTHRGQAFPLEASNALPIRSGSMKNRSYFALTSQSLRDFDWLLTFDTVTYHRQL